MNLFDSYKDALEHRVKGISKPNLGNHFPNLKIGVTFRNLIIFNGNPKKDCEILGDSLQVAVVIEQWQSVHISEVWLKHCKLLQAI